MQGFYPQGPAQTPADLTRPTGAYRRHAWWAVASLMLFVALYLALTAWFAWTAYRLLGEAVAGGQGDNLGNILVGASAAFLAVFMLKALFFVKRGEVPDAVEIKADKQPRLFEFLYRLADEAGAPRPKRVYLSPRVNAAVFYDLSLLNLLFPLRKNLEIGLALVNVLTLSEVKAVLAHEFGHFAQRSMAVGSWVYIAQQIAAQIVAKRDALDKALEVISRIDVRVAWIGWLLQLVVWSIRSLMDTVLRVVVLAQRALSRQMEFQADLVSVSLTGSDELVHALHKLQAADDSWGRTLNFADGELRRGRIPHDLFAVQTRIIETVGRITADESYGKVPAAAEGEPQARRIFKSSFAQPPQMWSTHPPNAVREDNAKRRYVPSPRDDRSAWLLFDDDDAVKAKVVADLLGKAEAEPASEAETFQALDERYALLQYQGRYRGAYLGRPLARHAASAAELYGGELLARTLTQADVRKALDELYPEQLAQDLTQLRELEEERGTLEAVRDKVYRADGGRIVYRGREIARRELPGAIREVAEEEAQVRQRILEHDRRCRSAHLAAAEQLGGGWKVYLVGLIEVLHYAEHALANVRDAQGLLSNIFDVVTANGRVNKSKLQRLLGAANQLHEALAGVYLHQHDMVLDAALCARLGVSGWSEMLEPFKLEPATKGNITNWLKVIDGWTEAAAGALFALERAALEQLLLTEDEVARNLREGTTPQAAPAASRVPEAYATLVTGEERKRERQLAAWDRFQTADGFLPAVGRLLVAGAIVGAVLGFGMLTGSTLPVSVYNGLDRTVSVHLGDKRLTLAPFSARQVDTDVGKTIEVAAYTRGGALIERFRPNVSSFGGHYVYNVAGAAPLVRWVAVYGSAVKVPPRLLGAPRWFTSSADVFFTEPPRMIQSSTGGATRAVVTGLGDRPPAQQLKLVGSAAARQRVIQTHLKWDRADAEDAPLWRAAANGH